MKITPPQAEALARLLLTIRPDWSKHYTADAVARMRLIDDDLEHIVAAAVRGALSPKIAKPDVLAMTGEHWKQPAPAKTTGGPRVLVTGRCERCGHLHPPNDPCIRPREETQAAAERRASEARAALEAARAELCPCGVKPIDCADHRPEPEETP